LANLVLLLTCCNFYKKMQILRDPGSCMPLSFVSQWLNEISDQERFKIITYNSLNLVPLQENDFNLAAKKEYKEWIKNLTNEDSKKIHLLIQYDVDAYPERTKKLLQVNEKYGIPANIMIFHECHSREKLKKYNKLELIDYEIDYEYLKYLETKGFVIGYHFNGYERALFNIDLTSKVFIEDVQELRKHFDIKYFSPHGGVKDMQGKTNPHCVIIPPKIMKSIFWVHNGKSVKFAKTYSDGGITAKLGEYKPLKERSLIDFMKNMEPGKRYRILLHPQYYTDNYIFSEYMAQSAEWYYNLCTKYPPKV